MNRLSSKIDKKSILLNLLTIIFFIIFIVSGFLILNWLIDNHENKRIDNKINSMILVEENENNTEQKYSIQFDELKKINNKVVGWLKVNGTNIEYPIVKAKDNSFYLNHNLENKSNSSGWPFADYKNKFDETDKNIIIYGHNRKDNSMFGTLKNILKKDWYNNPDNYIINFITENNNYKYQVFSVYQIQTEDYYIKTNFKNELEFNNFLYTLKARSIHNFNVEISEKDTILTLSTCANNYRDRIVLHAKLISE